MTPAQREKALAIVRKLPAWAVLDPDFIPAMREWRANPDNSQPIDQFLLKIRAKAIKAAREAQDLAHQIGELAAL